MHVVFLHACDLPACIWSYCVHLALLQLLHALVFLHASSLPACVQSSCMHEQQPRQRPGQPSSHQAPVLSMMGMQLPGEGMLASVLP